MSSPCEHHIVKPFSRGDGRRGFQETSPPEDGREYCTHPRSLHLPGSPSQATCGGDAGKCDIAGMSTGVITA